MMKILQWKLVLLLMAFTKASNVTSIGRSIRQPLRRIVNNSNDCKLCSCGLSSTNRIIGGTDSDVNKYPWVAMLLTHGYFTCGGSLINNKYVLTAAHCADPSKASDYEVLFLQNRLDTTAPNKITRKISQVIRHPNYNSRTLENDIALLKLSETIIINDKIRPVCLPSAGRSDTGKNAIIIGWGARKDNGPVSTQLQEVTVPIIANRQCQRYGLKVASSMICAGVAEGGKDSCQGDSGGPMHVVAGSKFTQVGIVSWGIGCGAPKRPGVYTKVSSYTIWIRRNTADSCSC